jgi:hypothetical protein
VAIHADLKFEKRRLFRYKVSTCRGPAQDAEARMPVLRAVAFRVTGPFLAPAERLRDWCALRFVPRTRKPTASDPPCLDPSPDAVPQIGYVVFLALLGAALNIVAYGFRYPLGGDYDFQLPLLNWIRNPALYPGDPIREAYARYPTLFWPLVAGLSKWFGTGHVLFAFLVLTKLCFFLAVGWLVAATVREKLLGGCIVGVLAVSQTLNTLTPFGASVALSNIQTQQPLGIALLLLAGVLLVLGRWRSAIVLSALTIYVDAVPFFHTACAFAIFALLAWRKQIWRIGLAAGLGFVICLPWLLTSGKALGVTFPRRHVEALLLFFPFHFTILWTPASGLIRGATLVAVLVCMCYVARKAKLKAQIALETLLLAYLVVVLSGIALGAFYLMPTVARVSLPRADSFLVIYGLLFIQIYGVNLLTQRQPAAPVTACLLGVLALVLPFSIRAVAPLFFIVFALWVDPRKRSDSALQKLIQLNKVWSSPISIPQLTSVLCSAGVLLVLLHQLRLPIRQWHVGLLPDSEEQSCYEVQDWARRHTSIETRFLVPPIGCGFRVISERSSWGEWKDGLAVWHYPPFADVFLQRVSEIADLPAARTNEQDDPSAVMDRKYKGQSWNRLQTIALENKLDYVVQFADVKYPTEPVFRNNWYAVYSTVPQ